MSIDLSLIEDETLRTEIEALGITIPHLESVLDPQVETFNTQLYYKLLAMEAYTYDHSEQVDRVYGETPEEGGTAVPPPPPEDYPDAELQTTPEGVYYYEFPAGLDQYQPFWIAYNDALLSYLQAAPMGKGEIKDFIFAIYTYIAVYLGRGVGSQAKIDAGDARQIFRMNAFVDVLAGHPLNHYDDFEPGNDSSDPIVPDTATNITADAAYVTAAYTADVGKVTALMDHYTDSVSDATMGIIFSNPEPPDPNAEWNATVAWDTIYGDLNWQWYVEYWNAPFNVPPRPEPLQLPTGDGGE